MKHLKSEFDKLTFREFIAFCIAICLMVSAIICIFLSMYIEPKGEIHESVLIYYSLSAASAAGLLGISLAVQGGIKEIRTQLPGMIKAIIDETLSRHQPDPEASSDQPAPGVHIERPAGG